MLPEGRLLGHYRVMRRIGSGGMGEVYLAEDTRINRQVAIKVVRTETEAYPDPVATQDAARLFQREMRAITMLDHPHILPLYDFGEEKDENVLLTYMVMPLREEGSLTDWLRKRGKSEKLTPNEVAHFITQAADALQDAHDHHLIHQDVKPSNFLVRRRSGNALPDLLLTDFGIAKMTTATATASQNIRGTPAFMAPEQWKGQAQSATDQYALAIMAYLLLTGHTPFSGRMEQVMSQHLIDQPQPPSSLNPTLSPALDVVILRALAKGPSERFPSILAFAQAFQEALQINSNQDTTITKVEAATNTNTDNPNSETTKPFSLADTMNNQKANSGRKSIWVFSSLVVLVILLITASVIGVSIYQNHAIQANNYTSGYRGKGTPVGNEIPVSTLHIAFRANDASNALYVTSSSDGVNWQTSARKQSQVQLQGSPTMAAFGGKLYIAFRSNDADNSLYVTSSSDGQTWPTATQFGIHLQDSPTIATFNNKLYIAFRANDASNALYVTSSSDGVNWQTPARKQSQVQLQGSPTMAAFGGKLYIAFRSNDADNSLYVTSSSDGQTWPTATQFGIHLQDSPTIAVF